MDEKKAQKYPMKCCLCGTEIKTVYQSHNARPISNGQCCEACNNKTVIPYRIMFLLGELK